MNVTRLVSTLLLLVLATVSELHGQPAAAPEYYQIINFIKVPPAGRAEFLQLLNDTALKTAKTRVADGQIVSWTLLRSVMPAGSEARADYMISTIYEGVPSEPLDRGANEELFKKAGVTVSVDEFYEKRNRLSSLVNTEMWRPLMRIGTLHKGNYMYVNYMAVTDGDAYTNFERTIWKPIAEQLMKDGLIVGWMAAAKQLPAGAETGHAFYTVDMFPNWSAAFAAWSFKDVFAKVHPGKNFEETSAQIGKLRTVAERDLWVVVERVAK